MAGENGDLDQELKVSLDDEGLGDDSLGGLGDGDGLDADADVDADTSLGDYAEDSTVGVDDDVGVDDPVMCSYHRK